MFGLGVGGVRVQSSGLCLGFQGLDFVVGMILGLTHWQLVVVSV